MTDDVALPVTSTNAGRGVIGSDFFWQGGSMKKLALVVLLVEAVGREELKRDLQLEGMASRDGESGSPHIS